MTGSGWNPTRRNRNIGTPKQGHGADNRLVIPHWPDDRVFWSVLKNPRIVERQIGPNRITFFVEPTQRGCVYPCTIDDVVTILEHVPPEHLAGLDIFLLRQPTRKQNIVSAVWGRFLYYAEPGKCSGPAICVEAQDLAEKIVWPKSLSPFLAKELDRLRVDGHEVIANRRGFRIVRTADSIRNTVLFRTVLHEIGHHVDWMKNVVWPCVDIDDPDKADRLSEIHFSKPALEREDFAHRYANELAQDLRETGTIPFAPVILEKTMIAEGLDPHWFAHGGNAT